MPEIFNISTQKHGVKYHNPSASHRSAGTLQRVTLIKLICDVLSIIAQFSLLNNNNFNIKKAVLSKENSNIYKHSGAKLLQNDKKRLGINLVFRKVWIGVEPTNNSFADCSLTVWVPHHVY